jgi:hypothetical protein
MIKNKLKLRKLEKNNKILMNVRNFEYKIKI